jgi:hypothetical protein
VRIVTLRGVWHGRQRRPDPGRIRMVRDDGGDAPGGQLVAVLGE